MQLIFTMNADRIIHFERHNLISQDAQMIIRFRSDASRFRPVLLNFLMDLSSKYKNWYWQLATTYSSILQKEK